MSRWTAGARLFFVILSLVLLALSAGGCGRRTATGPSAPKRAVTAPSEQVSQTRIEAEFQKASLAWDDGKGNRLFEARFKQATALEENKSAEVELVGVKASLYAEGKVAGFLSAPKVTADSSRKEVRASGGVKLATPDGKASATAEKMVWRAQEGRVAGYGSVRLARGGITGTAMRFEADTGLNKVRLYDGEISLRKR